MRITSKAYRLDAPEYAAVYVKRAGLIPLETIMAVSLFLVGIGFLGKGSPAGTMPLVFGLLILGSRYVYKPGFAERFVRYTQSGGRNPVPRIGLFTDEGLRLEPVGLKEEETKGVFQMPWDRLDRVEQDSGFLFFLPYPASPRGLAIPESAFEAQDLQILLGFVKEKGLIRPKTESSESKTATQ